MSDEPLTLSELQALLVNHLHRLPKRERQVLFRRLLHTPGMSPREVSHDLGITEKQVRHLEATALRRLRSLRDRGALFDTGERE